MPHLVTGKRGLAGELSDIRSDVDVYLGAIVSDPDTTHFYVSGVNGDDAHDGLSPDSALETLVEARARVPVVVRGSVVVHIGEHGGSGYEPVEWGPCLCDGVLIVIGDGAGQSGEDGFTQTVFSTAAAGTTTESVADTGMTPDTHRGQTLHVLTGSAAGQRRTIRSNTETQIVPCTAFSAAVQSGDLYRVISSNVVLDYSDTEDTVLVRAVHAGAPDSRRATAMHIMNLRVYSSTPKTVYCAHSDVLMRGVELQGTSLRVRGGFLGTGTSGPNPEHDVLAEGLAADQEWAGWGLSGDTDSFLHCTGTLFSGYVVGPSARFDGKSDALLLGGNLYGSVPDTLTVSNQSSASTHTGIPLLVSSAGTAIRVREAMFTLTDGAWVEGSGFAVDASSRGFVRVQSMPAVTGPVTVDGSSQLSFSSLSVGSFYGHTDGSVIRRDGAAASYALNDTALHSDRAGEISALAQKISVTGADHVIIEDSESSDEKRRVQVQNLPGGTDSEALSEFMDSVAVMPDGSVATMPDGTLARL